MQPYRVPTNHELNAEGAKFYAWKKRSWSQVSPPQLEPWHGTTSLVSNECWECEHNYHSGRMCPVVNAYYREPELRMTESLGWWSTQYAGPSSSGTSLFNDKRGYTGEAARPGRNVADVCQCLTNNYNC